jgi:flagellar hook assembly protein FlgD
MGGAIVASYYLGYIYAFVGGGSTDFYRRWYGDDEPAENSGGTQAGSVISGAVRTAGTYITEPGGNIRLSLRTEYPVRIKAGVYQTTGRKIREVTPVSLSSGEYRVEWDTRDQAGKPVRAGVYLIRLDTGNGVQTVKVLIK